MSVPWELTRATKMLNVSIPWKDILAGKKGCHAKLDLSLNESHCSFRSTISSTIIEMDLRRPFVVRL